MEIRPFRFFNNGKDKQFSDKDDKKIYTELMLRRVVFNQLNDFSNFKIIRISFLPGEARKPYQFRFKNLYTFKSPKNTWYFARNKDFVVIRIPPDTEIIVMEVLGTLDEELFDLKIEYFLV